MLVGFKRQFARFVEEGSKTHTIRAPRADGKIPVNGETLHCYVDPRQKTMRLLGRFKCTLVQEVSFARVSEDPGPDGIGVFIDGAILAPDEREALFVRDGFRQPGRSATQQAWDFWSGTGIYLPWNGYLIHWKFMPGTANAPGGEGTEHAGGKENA